MNKEQRDFLVLKSVWWTVLIMNVLLLISLESYRNILTVGILIVQSGVMIVNKIETQRTIGKLKATSEKETIQSQEFVEKEEEEKMRMGGSRKVN